MDRLTPPPQMGPGAIAQTAALAAIAILTGLMVGLTLMSLAGLAPWLDLAVRYGGVPLPRAGMAFQIGFTLFCVGLCFFLPSSRRILRLERSHREFHISMDDVARAYRASHAADRSGLFRASAEFDSVRERIAHLRNHPDLGALEPGVLEVAAQMGHEARELAQIYSDEKVARARDFLRQRQEEAARMESAIQATRATCDSLRHWLLEVQTEEALARRHLALLESELMDLLPQLGIALPANLRGPGQDDTVISLNRRIGDQAKRLQHPEAPV